MRVSEVFCPPNIGTALCLVFEAKESAKELNDFRLVLFIKYFSLKKLLMFISVVDIYKIVVLEYIYTDI